MAGLDGLRVLDISTGISGPFCAKLLVDGGAETLKIEEPVRGDSSRWDSSFSASAGEGEISALYAFLNQNKKSLSLKLDCEAGRDIVKQLVSRSDIVIESFAAGTLEKWGLGYEQLVKINPGIVLVSITEFGQNGPYRDYQANHLVHSALGGWSFNYGDPGREPLQIGFPLMYYMAGTFGAIGALAAIRGRRVDGKGQHLDLSVLESGFNIINYPQMLAQFNCPTPVRSFTASMQTFYVQAKDGWVALNHLSAVDWGNLCALIGAFHLAVDDTLLYDLERKRAILPEFMGIASEWAKDKTQLEVFHAAQELRVPAGIPYTPKEMLESEQFIAREFFARVQQPGLGEFSQPHTPFKSISWRTDRQPAPELGQDNDEVLAGLGLNVAELQANGVV